MDVEPNKVEEVDELQLLLIQRGLKRLPSNYIVQAPIAKLRFTQVSVFLSGVVTSVLYWGLVLLTIGVPLRTLALALLAILVSERVTWLLLMLAKVLGRSERFDFAALFARRREGAPRMLFAYGWMASTMLLSVTSISVSLMLVSGYTGDSILHHLYLFVVSIGQVIPFGSIRFYVILFCAILGIFVLTTLMVTVRGKLPITEAVALVLGTVLVVLYFSSILLVPLGLIFGLGILLVIAGVPLGAVYIVNSLQVVLAPISALVTMLSSNLIVHTSLVRVGANVLGVALLAALIPFLNADAWQLIASISWTNMAVVALLVYLWPMLVLMYTQRDVIGDLLRDGLGPDDRRLDLETLLQSYRKAQDPIDPHMEEKISNSYRNLGSIEDLQGVGNWNTRVKVKTLVRLLLLVVTLPLMVAVFCALFFYFMLDQQVLFEWTRGYIPSQAAAFTPFSLSGLTMLTIKAAVLFGLVSSTLTLGAQISSRDNLRQFTQEAFIDDMVLDRHLLIIEEICEHGGQDGSRAQDTPLLSKALRRDADDCGSPLLEASHLSVEQAEKSVRQEASPGSERERRVSTPRIDERGRRLLAEDAEDRPAATLTERRDLLEKACGVKVSESTISRTLKNLGYTRSRHGWFREK